jgi:hypothetical protein
MIFPSVSAAVVAFLSVVSGDILKDELVWRYV